MAHAKDFPPHPTVYGYFQEFVQLRIWDDIHAVLTAAFQAMGDWKLEIVKRSDTAKGFQVLPRRWVVERTLAWMGRNRRLASTSSASPPPPSPTSSSP